MTNVTITFGNMTFSYSGICAITPASHYSSKIILFQTPPYFIFCCERRFCFFLTSCIHDMHYKKEDGCQLSSFHDDNIQLKAIFLLCGAINFEELYIFPYLLRISLCCQVQYPSVSLPKLISFCRQLCLGYQLFPHFFFPRVSHQFEHVRIGFIQQCILHYSRLPLIYWGYGSKLPVDV